MDESIVKHLERPLVGTLKLSEAIRIGARMAPQVRGMYVDHSSGGVCAIGAAGLAAGFFTVQSWTPCAQEAFFRSYPKGRHLHVEITTRNDRGDSRESIADWLESIGY
jgi:hypothetical protein